MRHFRLYSIMLCLVLLWTSGAYGQLVSATPPSVSRDSVPIGSVAEDTIIITRTAPSPRIDSVLFQVGAAQWTDTLLDTLPYPLSTGGAQFRIVTRFSPTDQNTIDDTLLVYYWDGAQDTVHSIPLAGTGGLGMVSTSDSSKAFDTVLVGNTKDDSLWVYNTGTASMEVRLAFQSGGGAYTALPDSFAVLAGDSQQVNITFAPLSGGDLPDTLLVMTDTQAGVVRDDTLSVALTGTGIAPAIAFQPPTLGFGSVLVGTPDTLTFTISNPGTADLIIGPPSGYNAEFANAGAPSLPDTIPPAGLSSGWTVQFVPIAAGLRVDTLVFTTNIPGQPTVKYAMSGNGVNPDIQVSPTAYDFGDLPVGTQDTLQIDVGNVGTSDLTIQSVGLQIGLTEYTLIQSIAPGTIVAPGAQAQPIIIEVSAINPNLTLGDTVVIASDDPDENPVRVPLTAVTVETQIRLTKTSVDFGSLFIGQSAEDTLYIADDGTDTLTFTSVLGNSADFSVTPSSGDVLAGESLMVVVGYAPTGVGVDTSTWRLTTNAQANPQVDVPLTGTALSRLGTPALVNFGNVSVGESRVAALVLENLSTDTADWIPIDNITLSAGFTFVNSTQFPDTIAAQAAETLMVRFSPTAAGAVAGSATIAYVEPGFGADTLAVSLTGTGVASTRTIVRLINYPNPFIPESGTTILFGLGRAATVSLTIYDLAGQVLAEPVKAASYDAGEHEITWNGRRYDNAFVAFGVYICELTAVPSGGGEEEREYRKLACGRP